MIVEKIHEIISFKQNRWLEKYISFNTQKRNNETRVKMILKGNSIDYWLMLLLVNF